MFEKVNPDHPDKVADRIAGAIVDLAYKMDEDPKVAVEVLIGHGVCHIIAETSVPLRTKRDVIKKIVQRIGGNVALDLVVVPQDAHLAENQEKGARCGDNGIFRGMPLTHEQADLTKLAKFLYEKYKSDGKYIAVGDTVVVCQSNAKNKDLELDLKNFEKFDRSVINPLGEWTGGTDVDTGATNRKLGSDMGDAVTGGGLHGKDLSKADVSVNIYAHLKAQAMGKPVELYCAIGDETIDGLPYTNVMRIAEDYIWLTGGFERFAEWGLIR